MDHRISKDMISSGMTPSGEKAQEDLGRTQYGSNPTPNAFADAYKSMYEKKEEVINEHHKKDADGNTIPHEGEEINEFAVTGTLGALKVLGSKLAKSAVAGAAKAGSGKLGLKATATAFKKPTMSNISKVAGHVGKGMVKNPINTMVGAQMVGSMIPKPSMPSVTKKQNQGGMVSADADLFDIVKGQLLDEGLSEEEIKDIMLTLTPDEILKEIEESSMSAGSGGGTGRDAYSDGGDGVHRSFQQVGNMFNKNIPTKKQTGGKVDKMTRKSINTSARDFGIQGPSTLKQSVEPEGETI